MINSKLQQEKIRLDIMSIFSHVSISIAKGKAKNKMAGDEKVRSWEE
jgi:hypothetical protein